jgi:polygalacturonase
VLAIHQRLSAVSVTHAASLCARFWTQSGLRVHGASIGSALHLKDSPFWTLTPSYSQDVHISNLRITAPMDRIGNTDGVNIGARPLGSCMWFVHVCVHTMSYIHDACVGVWHLFVCLICVYVRQSDSCRRVVVENIYINNSDDGVCMKAGLDGFGLNLGIPSEDILVQNMCVTFMYVCDVHCTFMCVTFASLFRTCDDAGRGGFAIGSEMSGGVRNVTYRNSRLGAGSNSRGIDIKPSVGRGGYITDLSFENIVTKGIHFGVGRDGVPLMPGNDYVPLVSNMRFSNVSSISKPICASSELPNIVSVVTAHSHSKRRWAE